MLFAAMAASGEAARARRVTKRDGRTIAMACEVCKGVDGALESSRECANREQRRREAGCDEEKTCTGHITSNISCFHSYGVLLDPARSSTPQLDKSTVPLVGACSEGHCLGSSNFACGAFSRTQSTRVSPRRSHGNRLRSNNCSALRSDGAIIGAISRDT